MISEKMKALVAGSSVTRAMFEEGNRLAKIYGRENVYDFSLGNPNVPAPEKVKNAIIDIVNTVDPIKLHGYMSNAGYEEVTQAGVKGENRVTQKIQKINGETVNVVPVSTEVLKEPIKEIVVKGGKQNNYGGSYSGAGYGDIIATKGQWGWPASCSSVSSGFGYRWGVLHDGTDIAGCGFGSNIFAAQSGTVVQSSYKYDNGEFITIDHHNGFYSMYAHMITGSRRVKVGDNVTKGQVIGAMGRTGAATGVHLHFSIWNGYPYRGGRALNAMQFY